MRKIFVLIISILWSSCIAAQFVVIDNSNLSGVSIPFQDTLIIAGEGPGFGCHNQDVNYFFDLDQDQNTDVKFTLNCYMGGKGRHSEVSVSTQNSFSIYIDTNYLEYITDTMRRTTVVRKFLWGDTIYDNKNTTQTETYFHRKSIGYFPEWVYDNIVLFLGDTSYIAFAKNDEVRGRGDSAPPPPAARSIYYMKVYLPNGTTLELISLKTNDPTANIDEISANSKLLVYPNPFPTSTSIEFTLDAKSQVQISIFNSMGEVVYQSEETYDQGTHIIPWSPGPLPAGMYYAVLRSDDGVSVVKMVKQ